MSYLLSGEGAGSVFIVDESTGDVHATRRLDREQQASYRLRAQARDRRTGRPLEPESQFLIKVQDVNDNAPTFPDGPYVVRVEERAPAGESPTVRHRWTSSCPTLACCRDVGGGGGGQRRRRPHLRKLRPRHLQHPARTSLLLCGAQDR